MKNSLYLRLKRGTALLLALFLTIQPFFYEEWWMRPSFAATTEGQCSTFAYYDSSNLLKPGASFPFYGKDHDRVGLWPYGLTNVEDGRPAAGYCLEPNKSQRSGTSGTIVTYDLDLDGDNLPLGMSREEAEILWYALSSSGNFEGYQTDSKKVSQGHYILGQCATWAIMSGNWAGLEDFRQQMEVLMANLKSPKLAADTRGALEQFFNQTQEKVEGVSVPPFASKYKSQAPVHQMTQNADGTYSVTLDFSEGYDWRQSGLIYDLPEGWSTVMEDGKITFICTTGNPEIGLVKGHFPEGSNAARYWIKPNTFKIWFPDDWDETSAVEGKQAMITMAGKKETWEVWLSFGKGEAAPVEQHGSYEISYTQYSHEEVFKRDYKIELEKQCDETGKPLEGSTFEILEQFDFSQLEGTNLEEEQFTKMLPTSEGGFSDLSVCQSKITTDENGRFEHSDKKLYTYEKTYCGGHPAPTIQYVEAGEGASAEELAAVEEENSRLDQAATDEWQQCVDWCEENCDFHSIEEGGAREALEADRDEAWETFINLKRIYTVREIQARNGYILHDLHNDDLPVEIVEFSSSQAEGDGIVIGHYEGNAKGKTSMKQLEKEEIPDTVLSERETNTVWAAAATMSNARSQLETATDSNAVTFFSVKRGEDDSEEEGGDGVWEWSGDCEDSEVAPISQSDYPSNNTGYSYLVKDHRTEAELHINKRDMELYEQDEQGSYGKSQADATLEGAVYGLYAAEDIIHPDGKTGVVFKKGELVSIASTDKTGDASFVVITEASETSQNVPNLYTGNEERNGNGWIGRPLLLGSYFVEELSRSEGYELSRTGRNLSESNRTGKPVVLSESGSANTGGFYHRINEWDGSFYDFKVDYYNTRSFDIFVSGLPENARIYEITEKETVNQNQVIVGTELTEKKDASGNIIYQTAKGGEYKLDEHGNKKIQYDAEGNPVLSDRPLTEVLTAVNRLNVYVSEIIRPEPSDANMEQDTVMNEDYIIGEVSAALRLSGYKGGLSDAPWQNLLLSGHTNGEIITEILEFCASDDFWDAYEVEAIYEKDGKWYAKIRYAYKALKDQNAIYDKRTGKLVVRKEYGDGYYYAVYEKAQYEKSGYRFTIEKKEVDLDALLQGEIRLDTVLAPVYETYAAGEFLLDSEGQKIPVMETVPIYRTEEIHEVEEILRLVSSYYDHEKGRIRASINTGDEDFSGNEKLTRTFRVVVDGDITRYQEAAVSAASQKEEPEEGSYVKYAVLLYPGQYQIFEDDGTREKPIIVEERVIKQAIKVTKDIALDSYEYNSYEVHKDPFTVLFGGYNGRQETKTLPGFSFELYLRSDLEETGKLERKADGSYDYESFFKAYPEYETNLSLDWDLDKYDVDHDAKTVHANQGGGKDDYWGQSRMMPYGVYVLVEQQPDALPQKHYAIDTPQEIEIPFIPQVDADGTVHDKLPSTEYLYDADMTPEELSERYYIRFNEETHVIYAHNNDGDFEVFKYGLEPDCARNCQNAAVASYYHCGSVSEDAGKLDGVYYETYYDRDGNLTDYGVKLDQVDTITGISTAVDRKFAKALIPWSVLDPRYGEVIDDNGDIGNRDSGLDADGTFNFVAFSNTDFENEFYSSRLRIEKLDAETGENILHDGALFKIYAAKRDIAGLGAINVTGSGDVLFDENGIPIYDESEQIFMQDDSGAEVGIFRAYSTVRDGDVMMENGTVRTEKQCVGYIETYQPLGAGAYVLVEIEAPAGYVKSKPIAFMVYSDKVEYYEGGNKDKKVQAVKYQYVRPVGADGKTVTEDMHQIVVKDAPTKIEIHKLEKKMDSIRYRVDGDEVQLKARGDVELQYNPNGKFAGFGYVTRKMGGQGSSYVSNATLTLYEGLEVKKTGEHEYEGVKVERNLFDSVIKIQAYNTGVDTDIQKTGADASKKDLWDITSENNPPMDLWYFDLEYDPTELDAKTGILYGLDDWGNRICMLDSETGMAYVTDEKGAIIVWPLDENGDKIVSNSVEVYTNEDGKQTINMDLKPVTDENGLPIYYLDGGVSWIENEWVTGDEKYGIARVKQGAYILEETAAPLSDGYVQSMAVGLIVQDTSEVQSFSMEDDYTKLEISKLDMTSREEIEGATLTLYEAYRVYDDSDRGWHLEILRDSDDQPVVAETWVSEGGKTHWIDHIMPGDYILEETRVPTAGGYVTAANVEVIIEETEEVQGFVMEDDHTAVEVVKIDAKTGKPMDNSHRAALSLYPALLDENGEPVYDETGAILYDAENKIYEWQTDDGSEVRKTVHQVSIDGGHSYTAYDYDIKAVPGTEQAVSYVTETGAQRFEYLPVGKYVLVEEQAPFGYLLAEPVYMAVLDVGSKERIQQFTMVDEPIKVLLSKVNVAGGKELAGAEVAVYKAQADGTLAKHQMTDREGNLLFVTDTDGNFVKDAEGNLIPAMEYDENYLVERWISGSDGRYTKEEAERGLIPEGYEEGDLKPHELKNPVAGSYYFVEHQTPFGYVRASELLFTIVDTTELQKIELVDELIFGQLEIVKSDMKNPNEVLSGAQFKFTNLDTNVTTILITDEDGRAVSSQVPIGSVGNDGTVSLYHFSVQEVKAPEGYLVDDEVHEFQFNVNTDRYQKLVYQYDVKDAPNKVIISKKVLTTKEELPGAQLEVRTVIESIGEDGVAVKQDGELVESWTSTDSPHEIEYLKPGEYVLIETRAPEGFMEAEKVYFTIKANMTVDEIPYVEMFDDDTKVEIRKTDSETKEPLSGVRMQLIHEADGKLVKEWVTDETGSMLFTGLEAGNYLVKELETKEGYQLPKEPFRLTVTKDYKLQTFVLDNHKIEVAIEKRDEETREFVPGAVLRLVDETGGVAAEWTTGDGAKVIKGLKAGDYLLEEVKAKEGYLLLKEPVKIKVTNEEGMQNFTITNQKIEVDILKKDKESGGMLPGAKLKLIRNSDQKVIREWESSKTAEVFKGLVPGQYTLQELAAPAGYSIAEDLVFEVTDAKEKQEISLENEKITVEFIKADNLTGKPVEGAMLQLIKNTGTQEETIIKEWVSGTEGLTLKGVEAGRYVIRELEAPLGYVRMDDMIIEILPDHSPQRFEIRNQPIQAEIEKTNGNTGKLLGGATLQLVRNSDGKLIREWISKENEPEKFTNLAAGMYTVREVRSPSGFKKMEPQEIEIKAIKAVQEFAVKNYRIRHSNDEPDTPGPNKPRPENEYMELYKVDGKTGERLAGVRITVYRPDGGVYFEGVTGTSGTVRFKKPESGTYTFKETAGLDGYYLNGTVFQFTVDREGNVEGDDTIPNYKKTTVIISKEDVTTSEELPGAEIEITDKDGNTIFTGISDENGKVYFEVPEPGEYHFKEVVAPDGYELNETVFSFTVFDDGTIVGDCTVTDRKHYGRITASYETERKGEGDLNIGKLIHIPKTGDPSNMSGLMLIWLASIGSLAILLYLMWRQKKDDGNGGGPTPGGSASETMGGSGRGTKKWWLSALLLTGVLVISGFSLKAEAAETDGGLENIFEEHQYTTDNPDSNEAEKLFQKEIERDGEHYRLSEIRTEVVKEEDARQEERLEITSSPFLEKMAESNKPEEKIERDGETYCLVEYRLEESMIPAHEEGIKKKVLYEAVEAKDVVPSEIPVTVTDESTGQTVEGTAMAAGQKIGEKRWEDTFSFPATFHEYGLDGYWLGEKIFRLNGDTPDFKGYEKELLELIAVSEEDYQIESAVWDGEAYKDSDGVMCRNAIVSGKKLVCDCTVFYEGSEVFPEEKGVRYVAAYKKEGTSQAGAHKYTMKATGVYVPKRRNGAVLAAVVGLTGVGAGAGAYGYHRKKKKMMGGGDGETENS